MGALVFSIVVMVLLVLSQWWFRTRPIDGTDLFVLRPSFMIALTVAGVFSVWVLIAALLSVRPALAHPFSRWVWVWTLLTCGVLGVLGFMSASGNTMASVIIYACGMLSLISGAIGLTASAIPPRTKRDFYGRPMSTPEEWDAD